MDYFRTTAVESWNHQAIVSRYIETAKDADQGRILFAIKKDLEVLSQERTTAKGLKARLMLEHWAQEKDKFKKMFPNKQLNEDENQAPDNSTRSQVAISNLKVTNNNQDGSNITMNIGTSTTNNYTGQEQISNEILRKRSVISDAMEEENDGSQKKQKAGYQSTVDSDGLDDETESFVTMERTLWQEWLLFLDAAETDQDLHLYSAERHGIIVCGENIRRTEGMPEKVYEETVNRLEKRSPFVNFFSEELTYVDGILDAAPASKLSMVRKMVPGGDRHRQEEFLYDMFLTIIRDIYIAETDLEFSESVLSSVILDPSIRITIQASANPNWKIRYFPAEVQLRAMTQQLKNNGFFVNERNIYKADGIITINDIEVCILEISHALNQANIRKSSFDFHKGLYGLVAMIKTIADTYKCASFSTFSKLKLFFIHLHGKHIRLWSLRIPHPGLMTMVREDKADVPVSFRDDDKVILDFSRFWWNLKIEMEKSMKILEEIQEQHQSNGKKYRYTAVPDEADLSKIVRPAIIRLSERIHASYFVDNLPRSSPPMPIP